MQIPFNKPSKVGNEIEYIINAISTGHLSGNGKYTKLSENFFSDFFKAPALLTSSCTHSLEMVARLLQLEPGDEVIIPSFTFVSTANAFILNGARPVFSDINLNDLNTILFIYFLINNL
jgi:dTDP-4-amino-4,6-dideoxygalactose transaminase